MAQGFPVLPKDKDVLSDAQQSRLHSLGTLAPSSTHKQKLGSLTRSKPASYTPDS